MRLVNFVDHTKIVKLELFPEDSLDMDLVYGIPELTGGVMMEMFGPGDIKTGKSKGFPLPEFSFPHCVSPEGNRKDLKLAWILSTSSPPFFLNIFYGVFGVYFVNLPMICFKRSCKLAPFRPLTLYHVFSTILFADKWLLCIWVWSDQVAVGIKDMQ